MVPEPSVVACLCRVCRMRFKAQDSGELVCPESGWRYQETEPGLLRCLDWPEDAPIEERPT